MLRVGFVGWRGMVGSVLMGRMLEENDFKGFEAEFFSTTQMGKAGPDVGMDTPPVKDAYDIEALFSLDIIVTCQGGAYSKQVHPDLMQGGLERVLDRFRIHLQAERRQHHRPGSRKQVRHR